MRPLQGTTQIRQYRDEGKLKELGASIERGQIEPITKIVDAELIKDREYASMGKKPADRVKVLLGKLDSMRRSKERGYNVNEELR